MRDEFAVIVVGAGPTGLMVSNLLGLAGIDTLLIERNAGLSEWPKAISIDDEGLRTCQALGLGREVLANVLLDIGARYVSGERLLVQVTPTGRRNGYPLISTFNQPEFEATLLAGLQRFECVTARFQHTLEALEQSDQGIIASIRTAEGKIRRIACAYLLACDGGKSFVRRALGIPMRGSTFQQRWLVVDSIQDSDPSPFATFFCDPRRPAVSVPAPHNGRRWEFMLLPGETGADLLAEDSTRALIRQVGGPGEARIIRQAVYTFHAALARNFSRGRIFLLGDAAHLMPPFGGQGMNSGLRDAHNLAWKLALVLQGRAHLRLLETYHQERYDHVAQMIRFSAFLGRAVMPTRRSSALIRDNLLAILTALPPVRTFLSEARLKPQPRYKQGLLLSAGSRVGKSLAGQMLPQPQVLTVEGQAVYLDDVLGPGFALLRLHADPVTAFAPIKGSIWKRLDVRFVCVQPAKEGDRVAEAERGPRGEIAGSEQEERDAAGRRRAAPVHEMEDRQLSRFLGGKRDLFVLVRPDRYILGAFEEAKADAYALAFERMLGEEEA
ncbi:MAG: bifunctional 3-(3-hydroxy-phenyl)propionate/3-hydroxycinnamic acid hydroxylase [Chloroflexota bacterium]|nr:bifunctional 3-(3-hydroxy-phenyl)propionate/3-hydroxycinnamic acid hydroxylase [Chloroflexota bacterium]